MRKQAYVSYTSIQYCTYWCHYSSRPLKLKVFPLYNSHCNKIFVFLTGRQTVSLVTEASSKFLLRIHSASGISSLKICYEVGKWASPNEISTNDAQIVFSRIHVDWKKYFYPCLLTGSSKCHAVKEIKQKWIRQEFCTRKDIEYYSHSGQKKPWKWWKIIILQNKTGHLFLLHVSSFIVVGNRIHRALLCELQCSRRCICIFSFSLGYSKWKLSHCLSHSWPTTQRTVLISLPKRMNSLLLSYEIQYHKYFIYQEILYAFWECPIWQGFL